MSVQAVNKGLYWGFLQMSQNWGGLTRFLTQNHHIWIDQSERIDDHFS